MTRQRMKIPLSSTFAWGIHWSNPPSSSFHLSLRYTSHVTNQHEGTIPIIFTPLMVDGWAHILAVFSTSVDQLAPSQTVCQSALEVKLCLDQVPDVSVIRRAGIDWLQRGSGNRCTGPFRSGPTGVSCVLWWSGGRCGYGQSSYRGCRVLAIMVTAHFAMYFRFGNFG